jgi:chromosome segregation ATPase
MSRVPTSVSLTPSQREAVDNSDYGMSEFVQQAIEHALLNDDLYSLTEAMSEKEQERFEAFAEELRADADDLRADAEQHRQRADELDERADDLEARADRFTDVLADTTDRVESEIDEKRDDWTDAPDAEQSVDEAVDQLRNHDGTVTAEVLKEGPDNPSVETAAERAGVDPTKFASYAIDEIDGDDVEQKLSSKSWPPEYDWPPAWYVEPDAR